VQSLRPVRREMRAKRHHSTPVSELHEVKGHVLAVLTVFDRPRSPT
jgi:hypothetical protein